MTTTRFKRGERFGAAQAELAKLEIGAQTVPALAEPHSELVEALLGSLRNDPPSQSAAAEAALTIALIALAEGRPLNVIDPKAGDITEGSRRLEGDRTLSEHLSEYLGRKNVPCTKGAFQSNTYRSGYIAGQARAPALLA